jgi:muramoyltetrapeptide carboxypeptidase
MTDRREVISMLAAAMAIGPMAMPAFAAPTAPPPAPVGKLSLRKPKRLMPGDTVGLIEPASASDDAFDVTLVEEAITAMGLKPKRGKNVLSRYGYLAGTDQQRAADVNAMFADPQVKAIFAVRGGWGSARILPYLDYNMIRANPKLLIGYSDITALHMALSARAGIVSLHGPSGGSAWGKKTLELFREVAFDAAAPLLENPVSGDDRLAQRKWRTRTLTPGKTRGRLLGGNLTVLSAMVGTPYLPDFTGAILFLEDIDEAEYRIDRMMTQLAQAGILGKLAGFAFGQCTDCVARNSVSYGGFTLNDVLSQHIKPLNIPAFQGGFFGHVADQFSLPEGIMVEIDATAGTIQLLEAAVT